MPQSFTSFLKYLSLPFGLLVAGCAPTYSPNTYSGNAVQIANKVEPGVVIGYREVAITSSGTVGAVTGGAAGGVLGAQYADSALAAVGGTAIGALVGTTIDHATGDTTGWEYIVRKSNGDMLSVTQREKRPLVLGQKVLVITGPQARVVPDYSLAPDAPPEPPKDKTEAKAEPKAEPPIKVEVMLSLPPGVSAQAIAVPGQPVVAQVVTVPEAPPGEGVQAPETVSTQAPGSAVSTTQTQTSTIQAAAAQAPMASLSAIQLISSAEPVPAATAKPAEKDAAVVETPPPDQAGRGKPAADSLAQP